MPDIIEAGFHTEEAAPLPIQGVELRRVLGVFETQIRIEQSSTTSSIAISTQRIDGENGWDVRFRRSWPRGHGQSRPSRSLRRRLASNGRGQQLQHSTSGRETPLRCR